MSTLGLPYDTDRTDITSDSELGSIELTMRAATRSASHGRVTRKRKKPETEPHSKLRLHHGGTALP